LKFVIFNADDFGYTRGVNRGIVQAHRKGVVTSASLIVNGLATDEAVALAAEMPDLSVGLHVNFTNEAQRLVELDDPVVARDELRRQFDRFLEMLGRKPTHLDSHQHVHRVPACLPAFQELAAEQELPLRDNPPVVFKGGFYAQWEYGVSDPTKVSLAAIERIIRGELTGGIYEMACHPGYFDEAMEMVYHRDRELELRTLCDPRLRAILGEEGIRLIGFRQLAEATRAIGRTPSPGSDQG
jgi:chitin disaccharide deacetylase